MIKGRLFANIYLTKEIIVLDIDKEEADEKILKRLDFSKIVDDFFSAIPYDKQDMGECLNGIAYDEDKDMFTKTLKLVPSSQGSIGHSSTRYSSAKTCSKRIMGRQRERENIN